MIVIGGFSPNRVVIGLNGHFGIRPADIPTGGDFDSPLLDDADLPGDANTEFAWVFTTRGTGGGEQTIGDDGSFVWLTPPPGLQMFEYDGYAWPPSGPLETYAGTFEAGQEVAAEHVICVMMM